MVVPAGTPVPAIVAPMWITPVTADVVRFVPDPEAVKVAPADAVTTPPIEAVIDAADGFEAFRPVWMIPAAAEKLTADERLIDAAEREMPSTTTASDPEMA